MGKKDADAILLPIILIGGLVIVGGYFVYTQFIAPDREKEEEIEAMPPPPPPLAAPIRARERPIPEEVEVEEDDLTGIRFMESPVEKKRKKSGGRAHITNSMKKLAHSKEYKTKFIAAILERGSERDYRAAEQHYNKYLESVDKERARASPMDMLYGELSTREPPPNPIMSSRYAYVSI